MNNRISSPFKAAPALGICIFFVLLLQSCQTNNPEHLDREMIEEEYFSDNNIQDVVRMRINGEPIASYGKEWRGGYSTGERRSPVNGISAIQAGDSSAEKYNGLSAKLNRCEYVISRYGPALSASAFLDVTLEISLPGTFPDSYVINTSLDLKQSTIMFIAEDGEEYSVKIHEGVFVIEELLNVDEPVPDIYARGRFEFSGDGGKQFGEIVCTDGFFFTNISRDLEGNFLDANPNFTVELN